MVGEKQWHTEYPVYDKTVHLDWLCRATPVFDRVDLTGMYIIAD